MDDAAPLILLVDDEPLITCVVAQKVQAAGLRALVARDGEEALELARAHKPALVVTDLQMPRMSGLELAQALRREEATSQTPVIMLTGRGYILTPADLAPTNIRHCMSKPFSPRELLSRITALVTGSSGQGAGARAA